MIFSLPDDQISKNLDIPAPSPKSTSTTSAKSFLFDDLEPEWVKRIQDDAASISTPNDQICSKHDSDMIANTNVCITFIFPTKFK